MNGAVHGRGQHHRQHAGEEIAGHAVALHQRAAALADADVERTNTPDRLRPNANTTSASSATTSGCCNWKPQPSASPALRKRQRQRAERGEADQHAGGVGQRVPARAFAAFAALRQ